MDVVFAGMELVKIYALIINCLENMVAKDIKATLYDLNPSIPLHE